QQRITRNTAVQKIEKPIASTTANTTEKTLNNTKTIEPQTTKNHEVIKAPKNRKLFYWLMSIILLIMIAVIIVATLVITNVIVIKW
ncbi:MAG: hypothetical protein ACRC63_02650, partial [Metamycoplasmataceae bacterium]